MSYDPHEQLAALARDGRSGLGWTVLGAVGVVALNMAGTFVFLDFLRQIFGLGIDELLAGATPLSLMAILCSFAFWILAIATVQNLVHRRDVMPMLGAGFVRDFRAVAVSMLALYLVVFLLPPWGLLAETVPALPLSRWVMLLPLSLIAVFIQVSAEELLFRGYLQQQLAARFSNPLIWIGLPTVLFALAHYDAELNSNAWLYVVWAGVFGLMMADLTARSGSLGPAIAVHMVNNVVAMLLVSPPDSLSGLALYHFPFTLSDEAAVRAMMPLDFALMFVSWLAARLALRA